MRSVASSVTLPRRVAKWPCGKERGALMERFLKLAAISHMIPNVDRRAVTNCLDRCDMFFVFFFPNIAIAVVAL